MASVLEYKCPNCSGHIKFDPTTQKFKCEYCDSVFTSAELAAQTQKAEVKAQNEKSPDISAQEADQYGWTTEDGGKLGEMSVYSCQSCGAKITTDVTTVASKCPYCDSPVIMTGKVSGLNRPNCIIPFKLDGKAAGECLKKFCRGKIFLPRDFLGTHKLNEIKGVYVPFWLFDSDVRASIRYEATRVKSWSDKDYNYTETSYYDVHRGGTIAYSDIPVDASTTMPDDYMDGVEPFNYGEMGAFNPAFLTGFMADKYDVEAKDAFPRAEKRIKNAVESSFARTVTGYNSVRPVATSINPSNSRYKYAMLPVWLLNAEYNGEKHLYAVNGQTGKVSGSLPVDKKRVGLVFAAIAAAITAILQIFIW